MCTVSFYHDSAKTIMTSNRDEHINRPLALAPTKINTDAGVLVYPQDPLGKGTWFCIKNNGSIVVLLNGADKKHKHAPPYKKSRGLVVLDLIMADDASRYWNEADFEGIEPFTIVSFQSGKLFQMRWNETTKTSLMMDVNQSHIWSSFTLYEPEVILNREKWFSEFLKMQNQNIEPMDFIRFHMHTESNDSKNGLIINRGQKLLTKNITQTVIRENTISMEHRDLLTNEVTILTEKLL